MSASDAPRPRAAALAAVLLAAAGCDDPTASLIPGEPPPELTVVATLDPRAGLQLVHVDAFQGLPADAAVTARLFRDGTEVAAGGGRVDEVGSLSRCAGLYGVIFGGGGACVEVPLWPEPGVEYELRVTATGRDEARAVARAVEPLEIVEAELFGAPPDSVHASWTASGGAHRYLVSVSSLDPACLPCSSGWGRYTGATELGAPLPADAFAEGPPPYAVEVRALDRALHAFLTTGATGDLFVVPPLQNVEGGRGVFGSWTSARVEADRVVTPPSAGPWRFVGPVPARADRVVPDPTDPAVLMTTAFAGAARRSEDGGRSWTTDRPGESAGPAPLAVAPDGTALLGRADTLLLRPPGTGAWTAAATFGGPVLAVVAGAGDGVVAVATADPASGVVRLHRAEGPGAPFEAVATWTPTSPPTHLDLVEDPFDGSFWLRARRPGALLRSADRGRSWGEPPGEGLPAGDLEDLAPAADGTLYLGVTGRDAGTWVSRDRGTGWTRANALPARVLGVHPARPGWLWIGVSPLPSQDFPAAVHLSTDRGADPTPTGFAGMPPRDLVAAPTGDRLLLLASDVPVSRRPGLFQLDLEP